MLYHFIEDFKIFFYCADLTKIVSINIVATENIKLIFTANDKTVATAFVIKHDLFSTLQGTRD